MSRPINILCVGKAKPNSPEKAIFDKYVHRCAFDIRLTELNESKAKDPKTAMLAEAKNLQEKLPKQAFTLILDERGRDLNSPELAKILDQAFFNQKTPTFIIGGSFGIDPNFRQTANIAIRFGRFVWPHLLIRGMLAEQIYRAQTILDRHPYHRM